MGRSIIMRRLPFIFGILTFGILTAGAVVGTADAAWGRGNACGYFYNNCGAAGYQPSGWSSAQRGSLFQNGVPGWVNSVSTLITWLQSEYGSGQPNQNMAAFVVRTMQGQPGGSSTDISASDWNDLQARLTQPGISIDWSVYHSAAYNTYQQSTNNRQTSLNDAAWTTQGQDGTAIVIYYNGSPVYALFHTCGNPDGGLPGIPADPLPISTFDGANCSTAVGWAFDPSRSSQSLYAHLQVDKNTVIWGMADQDSGGQYSPPRDVNGAYTITGKHRFVLDISPYVSDGKSHKIDVYTYNIDSAGTTIGGALHIGSTITVSGCLNYTLTPSVSSSAGAYIEAGDTPNFTYQVKNTGTSTSPVVADAVKQYVIPPGQSLKTYAMQDNITTNCNNAFSSTLCATSWQLPDQAFGVGTTSVTTAGSSPPYAPISTASLPVGTSICQILAVDPAGNDTNGNPIRGRWSAPSCVTVVAKPYFTVTGGDISSNGNITSWNVNNVGGAGYAGAGSQLAALATGNITGFVTGTGMSSNPTSLAFANTATGGSSYGGGYTMKANFPNVSTAGATDLYAKSHTYSIGLEWWGPPPMANLASGTYYYNHSVTIGGVLATGKNVTLVITNGDFYIGDNIMHGAYTNPTQIPRLTVIVENGNIYVQNNVTEIHGVFYAGGAGKGNFYSCAVNAATPINSLNAKDHYGDCNHPLTVYGAVTANALVLNRTYGSLHASASAPAAPAENFFYSPEVWLAPAATGTGSSPAIYNSYVSLPPIL